MAGEDSTQGNLFGVAEGTKRCSQCRKVKPLGGFYVISRRGRREPSSACIDCQKAANRSRRDSPPAKQCLAAEKRCTGCGTVKPLTDFYKTPQTRDGRTAACAECTKAAVRRTAERNRAIALTVAEKRCQTCGAVKQLALFNRQATGQFGRDAHCKSCRAERAAQRHLANKACPVYRRKRQERDRVQGLRRYGMTDREYAAMYAAQGGLCAICREPEKARINRSNKVRQLCVDHDHRTGKIRKLLCSRCNAGIGNFRENVDSLKSAIAYLDAHREP